MSLVSRAIPHDCGTSDLSTQQRRASTSTRRRRDALRVEWPTVAVALAIYGGFGLLTWFHAALPWWVELPLGAYLIAWHASLQHEVVHGHPTTRGWLNRLLVFPSLWLWLPYEIYRETHLRHHRDRHLTDPVEDPESYYVTPGRWAASGGLARRMLWLRNTLLGRLAIGPLLCLAGFFRREALRLWAGDRRRQRIWAVHALSVALVLAWVTGAAGMPALHFLLVYVYPGIALAHLRSFLEHRAHPEVAARTAVVEAGPVLSLLFLNNNLHSVHHDRPRLAWYRIPAVWRAERAAILAANRGYHFPSYLAILRRWALSPKEPPVHPLAQADAGRSAGVAYAPETDAPGVDARAPTAV
jgi:fatty acid desaturase